MSSISNEFIELKIDTVEYPMTEDKADELENLFQEVSSAVKDAKSGLEREDKVRELYSFSKDKVDVKFPFLPSSPEMVKMCTPSSRTSRTPARGE